MSQAVLTNRELCDRIMAAYGPHGIDELLGYLDPEVEWATTEQWMEREVWVGHAQVRAGLERFFAAWTHFSNELLEFRDGGDRFAVVSRMSGVAPTSGISAEMLAAGVIYVRDGVIVRVVGHSDPRRAMQEIAG
ncbi:MAG TPA: nuclear transport factor 2 family protein [Thermoleophilaceae bacterium]|nr:nuclear transport factor 2 family protein [Thermoleophilaceae bacterium]